MSRGHSDRELEQEFQAWLAMGQGGLPATREGFMINKQLEKIALADTLTLQVYSEPEQNAPGWANATAEQKEAAQKSYLSSPLKERAGPRARSMKFVAPQRERNADMAQDEAVKAVYVAAFKRLGTDKTEWKTSVLEKQGDALFVKDDMPLDPIVELARREICHIHGSDLSAHVTLSFEDAREVISKGWGERHRLSGTSLLPLGYTMLYVPNSVEEAEVIAKILEAGVRYMTGSSD